MIAGQEEKAEQENETEPDIDRGKKAAWKDFIEKGKDGNRILFTELQKCEKNLLRKGKGNFILSGLSPNCLPQEGNL